DVRALGLFRRLADVRVLSTAGQGHGSLGAARARGSTAGGRLGRFYAASAPGRGGLGRVPHRGAAGGRPGAFLAPEEGRGRQAGGGGGGGNGAMIVVTGFEAFGGHPSNPSEEIAKALDGRVIGGQTVHAAILPVHHTEAARAAARLLAEHDPVAVLHVGL